jgi:hypothetical protein
VAAEGDGARVQLVVRRFSYILPIRGPSPDNLVELIQECHVLNSVLEVEELGDEHVSESTSNEACPVPIA